MTYRTMKPKLLLDRKLSRQYALLCLKAFIALAAVIMMTACGQQGGGNQTNASEAGASNTSQSRQASSQTTGASDSGAGASEQVIEELKNEYPAPIKTPRPLSTKPPEKRVQVKGRADPTLANAKQAAVEDALRKAVKHVGGMQLGAVSESRNFTLVEDVIYTRTVGYISKHQIINEIPRNPDGLYEVTVECVVSKGSIDFDVELFKSTLKRMGTPEIMVLQDMQQTRLENNIMTQLQDQLKMKGIRVIDPEAKAFGVDLASLRADHIDKNLVKAAITSKRFPCDVVALVNFSGELGFSVQVGNVRRIPATANCSIRLIRVDTAEALANVVVTTKQFGDTDKEAELKAAQAASKQAMAQAIEKIAKHWMVELNDEGRWIRLVTHKYSFDRTMALSKQLKKIPAIMEVQNKHIDEEATGEMIVRTTVNGPNLGMIIRQLDRNTKIRTSRFELNLK